MNADICYEIINFCDLQTMSILHAVNREWNHYAKKNRHASILRAFQHAYHETKKIRNQERNRDRMQCILYCYLYHSKNIDPDRYIHYGRFIEDITPIILSDRYLKQNIAQMFHDYQIPKPMDRY